MDSVGTLKCWYFFDLRLVPLSGGTLIWSKEPIRSHLTGELGSPDVAGATSSRRMRICVSTRDLAPLAGTPLTMIFICGGSWLRGGRITRTEDRPKVSSVEAGTCVVMGGEKGRADDSDDEIIEGAMLLCKSSVVEGAPPRACGVTQASFFSQSIA